MRRAAMTLMALAALAALVALAALAASPAFAAPATPRDTTRVERFSGTIRRGERFERRVFGGLGFRLLPIANQADRGSDGWQIQMFGADSLADFAGIATPPYHGVNSVVIEAWHFRSADNSGPNTGDVNAPQEERGFQFVTSASGYAQVSSALDLMLWPNGRPQSAVDSSSAVYEAVPKGEGLLVIREMKLAIFGKGVAPWIESMKFDVELKPPPR